MTEYAPEFRFFEAPFLKPGESSTFTFAPVTPGPVHVIVSGGQADTQLIRTDADGRLPRITMRRRRIGQGPAGPGDGEIAPGDPPTNPPIDPDAFEIELRDPMGTVAQGPGPLLSSEATGRAGPVTTAHGEGWEVEVTNNSSMNARISVEVRFTGLRPIKTKPFDIEFINNRLDFIFNSVQPFQLQFVNRVVVEDTLPAEHTFVRFEADPAWAELHDWLREEHDLGGLVMPETTHTTEISLQACVHDAAPAIRARIRTLRNHGQIDLVPVIGMFNEAVADAIHIAIDVTPLDPIVIDIGSLDLDVFFVLRSNPLTGLPTFQIIAQPDISLDLPFLSSDLSTIVARLFAQAVFEVALPAAVGDALDEYANGFAGWILGDRDPELVGGKEALDIKYLGTAPAWPPLTEPVPAMTPQDVPIDPGNLAQINHVVVVMMENRSFDHMLGYLSLPTNASDDRVGAGRDTGRSKVNGLTGQEVNPFVGRAQGRRRVFPLDRKYPNGWPTRFDLQTRPTRFRPDPGHSYVSTKRQRGGFDVTISPGNIEDTLVTPPLAVTVPEGGGFVYDFAGRLSGFAGVTPAEVEMVAGEIMGYHPAAHVPTFDFFADRYGVCDRWYAAVPAGTWPNRFVSLTGQLARDADGMPDVQNPDPGSFDPLEDVTIVDHLRQGNVSVKYYEHNFCMLRTFSAYTFDHDVIRPVDEFFNDAAAEQLPDVSFIEPDLTAYHAGNDDHPPADISDGQVLLHRVYEALVKGPRNQWNETLLLITYDEHGGFYDHVTPKDNPVFVPDPNNPAQTGFVPIGYHPSEGGQPREPILHYGMRVPTLVVSPLVKPKTVSSTIFDHTSILKTIIATFMANDPPDMGWRVAVANHVGEMLTMNKPQPISHPPVEPLSAPQVMARPAPTSRFVPVPGDDDFRDFMREFARRVGVRV